MPDGNPMKVDVVSYILSLDRQGYPADGNALICKFVVIRFRDILTFVIGPVSGFPYHAALIDRFCRENQLASFWVKRPDFVEVLDDSVAIRGGGWAQISENNLSCRLYGASTAYGAFLETEVRSIIDTHQFFSGFSVSIDN